MFRRFGLDLGLNIDRKIDDFWSRSKVMEDGGFFIPSNTFRQVYHGVRVLLARVDSPRLSGS